VDVFGINNHKLKTDMFDPTPQSSRRESGSVEKWCALTSLCIVYAGVETKDTLVVMTGLASFLSHVVPIKIFYAFDLVFAMVLGTREVLVRGNCPVFLEVLFLVDFFVRRTRWNTLVHSFWHVCVGVYFCM
jgi:hypothetical protein